MIENGYDNFVVNWRGTMYSLGHDDPNITKEKYWDFSWQEMASYDFPAFYKGVSRVKWGDANYNQVGGNHV
jgi:lysosomal acid lipase/cholesteryl ester hydrolase